MAFRELEGRQIERSVGEFHVAPDGSESLLHLGLHFAGGESVTLGCASDGHSLQVAPKFCAPSR